MTAAKSVGLHEPVFSGNEWTFVKECLDTGWVSSAGKFVERFEKELSRVCATKHAVALVNGTAALDLGLKLLGVKAGDEVIVPSITFIATVNAVSYQGATPLFIDVDETTCGLNPDALRAFLKKETKRRGKNLIRKASGARIAACVPMHALGHPVRIDEILEVCAEFGIQVFEDAAEALGSSWRGRPLGSFGRLAALSFNGNKIATTGGGGAIVTDDDALAARAKHLSTQAKSDAEAFWHDAVGFNYRLPNINAALGCAQLEQLDRFIRRKREIAQLYREKFSHIDVRLLWEPAGSRSNFWLNTIACSTPERAVEILKNLRSAGFGARPLWAPAHLQPMYAKAPRGDLSATMRLWKTCVSLPSSASLSNEDVSAIARVVVGR